MCDELWGCLLKMNQLINIKLACNVNEKICLKQREAARKIEGFGIDLNLYRIFSNNREFNLAPFYASPWHNNGNAMYNTFHFFATHVPRSLKVLRDFLAAREFTSYIQCRLELAVYRKSLIIIFRNRRVWYRTKSNSKTKYRTIQIVFLSVIQILWVHRCVLSAPTNAVRETDSH